MRHKLVWFAFVALLAMAGGTAAARNAPVVGSPPIAITINGEARRFATPPITMGDQVLVPMRDVFETLNATVVWHGDTRAVTAHNSEAISLRIGHSEALVGRRPVMLAVAPILYEDRTYVPLQFVHDALGAQVAWDATGRTVTIAGAAPAVAMAPQQIAEAEPQTVAPAQPQVPPAAPPQTCPAGQGMMRPQARVAPPYQADDPTQTQVVAVRLTEYKITLNPTEVHPGSVTLQVRNDGTRTHALAIENTNLRIPDLNPGQATTLTFTAESGKTYTLYCPIDEHRLLGMKARLPVK
jgi:hypothetical protein